MSDERNGLTERRRRNLVVAGVCAAFFAGMVGMSYAAVPLYEIFCRVTGYGGTTQRVTQYSDKILDEKISVRFDANTNGVPWDFKPVQVQRIMQIGETVEVYYTATNRANYPTRGRATFNVAPAAAGAYFNKLECFCFSDTELKPGETLEMPVVFYVDPEIVNAPELKGVRTITLSYTFFPLKGNKPIAAASSGEAARDNELGG
jgi:cytochrome c oxidase assembly protein subunit 11